MENPDDEDSSREEHKNNSNNQQHRPANNTLAITPRRSARLNPQSPADTRLQRLLDRVERIEIDGIMRTRELDAIREENKRLKDNIEEAQSKIADQRSMEILPGLSEEEMKELTGKTFMSIYHALENTTATTFEEQAEAAIERLHEAIPEDISNAEETTIRNELKTARKMIKEWDTKLENYNKATEFFEKYDYYARVYKISKKQRFDRLATALLGSQIDIEFRAARNNQNIHSYDDMKKWMFRSRDGIARIAQFETKLSNWKMKKEHNLLQAYQELMAIVNRYIEEIKFATKWGAKEHEITKVPEPWLFNMFINATKEPYRGQLWDLYLKKISGVRSMRKAELLVKHIHATRPMNNRKAAAGDEINAMFYQSGKWCSFHKSTSHNTAECRELKQRDTQPNNQRKKNEMERKNWRNTNWRNKRNNRDNRDNRKWSFRNNKKRYYNGKSKYKRSRNFKKNAIFAIAKDILNWKSSEEEDRSEQEQSEESTSSEEEKTPTNSDENRILSEEDDDEARDESNEQAETIAALQKLVRAKYGYQSPRQR